MGSTIQKVQTMQKILIDLTQIPINKVGVGVYALQTFYRIITQDKQNQYYLVIQDDDQDLLEIFTNSSQVIRVHSKLFRHFPLRILLEQIYLPWLILRHKIDIIHSLHYSFPFFSFHAKRVVTIHDMTFFLFPNLHTKIKRFYFQKFIQLSTRFVDQIICVSESTACDLKTLFPKIKPKIISVIPLACSLPKNIQPSPYKNPYITFIGTLEPRKNIETLIKAFALGKFDQYKLIIVGKKGWFYKDIFRLTHQLGLEDKIIFTGFVTEDQKFAILRSASLFVYPSLYEGFGLPVLEALSLNVPTITSNISSLPEIAGNAAILVDPHSVKDLNNAMHEILDDEKSRSVLLSRAQTQAAKFNWDKTAAQTIKVYNSLC